MIIMMIIIIIEGEVVEDGGETPCPPGPPTTPQQEMDDIVRRLDYLRGNMPDISPDNTREQILELLREKIMKSLLINKLNKDKEKFQICQK